jgi:hypothetical protein
MPLPINSSAACSIVSAKRRYALFLSQARPRVDSWLPSAKGIRCLINNPPAGSAIAGSADEGLRRVNGK